MITVDPELLVVLDRFLFHPATNAFIRYFEHLSVDLTSQEATQLIELFGLRRYERMVLLAEANKIVDAQPYATQRTTKQSEGDAGDGIGGDGRDAPGSPENLSDDGLFDLLESLIGLTPMGRAGRAVIAVLNAITNAAKAAIRAAWTAWKGPIGQGIRDTWKEYRRLTERLRPLVSASPYKDWFTSRQWSRIGTPW